LNISKNILIQQLKQQQRLGNKKTANDAAEFAKILKDKVGPAAEKFIKNATAASNETSKLSAGVGRARAGFDDFSNSVLNAADNISSVFDANKKLTESFGLSAAGAFDFSKEIRGFAAELKVGDKELFKFAASLGKATQGFISSKKISTDFKKELFATQKFLQTNLKLSEEQASKFELYSAGLGRSGQQSIGMIGKVAATFKDALGMDQTQIMQQITADITDMGADTVVQFGRIPGQLENATMKARLLGTTMENLSKAGETMLNIESSVGAEMEYQLLTGKRMLTQDGKSLTNAFRMAQLQGNGVKQAELMQHYLEEHGDELDNNFLARKKASEIFGTDAATLMEMKRTLALTKELGVDELVTKAKGDLDKLEASLLASGKVSKDEIDEIIKGVDTRSPAEIAADKLTSIDSKITAAGQISVDGAKAVKEANAEIQRTIDFAGEIGGILSSQAFLKTIGSIGTLADQLGIGKGTATAVAEGAKGSYRAPEVQNAAGGFITGPGTGTSDSIPARLSDGEYVINAASTRRNRALLDKINNTPVKMAAGGPVGSTAKMESLLATMVTLMRGGNVLGETSMNGRKRI